MKLLIKLLIAGGAISAPAFTATLTALTNATGTVTTRAYINPGSGGGGVITPAFTMTRTTGVAPLGVHFDASGTTAPTLTSLPFHELYYAWSFGDPAGGATWAYGTRPGVASKNTAYGPIAAHVFETPGTYTATLYVYHINSSGGISMKSVAGTSQITVTDPDTVFSGTNTICLSTGTDFTGAPSGASTVPSATTADIQTACTSGKRVLLKKGDTWNTTTSTTITSTGGILGAFGTGAKPKIRQTGTVTSLVLNGATDWRIVDIEVTSDGVYQPSKGCLASTSSTNIYLLRCDLNQGRNIISAATSTGLGLFDCVVHESFATAGICAYLDKVDNLAIYGTWMYLSSDHTCRVQGTAVSAISNNFFERPGAGNGAALTVRGKANDANVDLWNGLWTEKVVIANNVCTASAATGGGNALAIKPQASGHAERLRNVVVDGNVLSSDALSPIVSQVSSGLTIRNNIVITRYAIGMDFGYSSTSTDTVPPPDSIWIYNNSFYKPDTTSSNGFTAVSITNTTAITGMVVNNNVAYAPTDTRDGYTNGTAPRFFDSNTATLGVHYTLGVNSSNAQVKSSLPFTTAAPLNYFVNGVQATPSQFTPTGYAVNAGTYVPIYQDFFATQISGTRELGAIQA